METQTIISGDLDYMKKDKLHELREELGDVERMLKALIKSLKNKHLNRNSERIPRSLLQGTLQSLTPGTLSPN